MWKITADTKKITQLGKFVQDCVSCRYISVIFSMNLFSDYLKKIRRRRNLSYFWVLVNHVIIYCTDLFYLSQTCYVEKNSQVL